MRKLLVTLVLLTACAGPGPKKIVEDSEKVQGVTKLVFLDHKRLVFYVQTSDKVVLCHAYNESNKSILAQVENLTKEPGTYIILYGTNVTGDAEYLSGVDFIASAIELTNPVKHDKVFIDLNYGDRIKDAFSFRGLVKQGLKKATDTAISAVKP